LRKWGKIYLAVVVLPEPLAPLMIYKLGIKRFEALFRGFLGSLILHILAKRADPTIRKIHWIKV